MCGPWALPVALIAAGSGAQYLGNKRAERAGLRSYRTEQRRQDALTGDQQEAFQNSLKATTALTDPNAEQKAVDERMATLASVIAPKGDYLPGAASAAPIVKTAADKAAGESGDISSQLALSLARLGGASDQLQRTNITMGRDASRIGQLASFKAGSANVLDAELRAAANKGSTLRGLGSLAQMVGAAWLGNSLAAPAGGGAAPQGFFQTQGPINSWVEAFRGGAPVV